jgi:RHS repeat-associated protein
LEVRQVNGQSSELTASYTYDTKHRRLTATNAAGQTTIYTYSTQGQLLTVTTPPRAGITENRTTTSVYDTNGYLQTVTGAATGATTTYTYDGYGRMRTATDSDGYGLTYDYDALDRPTKITHPDGTYEETVYNRLDGEKRRDRLGRWSHTFYDALRRPTAVRDAAGRTVTQQWCTCGSLDKLIDGNNNATTWERDLQGRVTREVRANGLAREYTYETTTSRLKKVKDAKNQETQLSYFLDDHVQQVSYVNAQIATPTVSYTFDPVYGRPATMTDGTGATIYSHHPIAIPPALGAGMLASVDGPLSNDTITYSYDERGRMLGRTMNSVTTAWAFDALGRLTTLTDPIGAFTYSYVNTTVRLSNVTYPNGQATSYTYLPNTGDRRLQDIHHKKPDATTLSRFTYGYDADGNVKLWTQQSGTSPANAYDFGYDNADEISSAIYRTTDPTPVILRRYGYAYDPAGNRTAEQIDDAVTGATYDNLNRLVSQQPGGALLFKGTTNEAATVTVGGKPSTTTPSNVFTTTTPVPSGTSTVQVQATDPSGNVRTNTYEVSQAGTSKSFTYDANGNLTSDGTRTYEWDAADRLVTVKEGANTLASFTYDGSGRRATKTAAGVTTTYVYDAADILELRLSSGASKRFVQNRAVDRPLAEVSNGVVSYLVADHLGSVTERTDSAGSTTLQRRYDPWGRILTGGGESGYAYTGREWDEDSDFYYYRARHYDAAMGRFLSEDPIGLIGGPNRYAYVQGNPVNLRDPSGTHPWPPVPVPPVVSYCLWNPLACGLSTPCMLMAEGIEHILTNGQNSDDDRNNALKHCTWACCIAQGVNRQQAIGITFAYEVNQRWTAPCSSQMDRHNNMLGATMGSANPNMNCFDLCDNAGSLQCQKRNIPPYQCTMGE